MDILLAPLILVSSRWIACKRITTYLKIHQTVIIEKKWGIKSLYLKNNS